MYIYMYACERPFTSDLFHLHLIGLYLLPFYHPILFLISFPFLFTHQGNTAWSVHDNILWHPSPNDTVVHGGNQGLSPSQAWKMIAFMNDGGRETAFTNNMVIDSQYVYFNGAAGLTWDKDQQMNTSKYFSSMHQYAWRSPPYSTAYPSLALLDDYFVGKSGNYSLCARDYIHCGAAPAGNKLTGLLIINITSPAPFDIPPDAVFPNSLFVIQDNFQANSTVELGFCDGNPRQSLNFLLSTSSPVFGHSSYRPVDYSHLGPYSRNPMRPCSESSTTVWVCSCDR